jgi:hypothetical protein
LIGEFEQTDRHDLRRYRLNGPGIIIISRIATRVVMERSALLLTAYRSQCLTRSSAVGGQLCPMLTQARPQSAITPFHVGAEFLNVGGTGSTHVATSLLQFGRRPGWCARSRWC